MSGNSARWIRAALQVNPFGYQGRNAPSQFFADEQAYNNSLLDECAQLSVSLIAITDHWCVDSAHGLVQAAGARGITALPGFEANSAEGIHILVIFEKDTSFSVVNAAIGQCGGTPGGASGTVGASYSEIMEKMQQAGALAIPAHVNAAPAGMLTTRSGQPLAAMIKHEYLNAIGISPNVQDAKDQASVVNNSGIYSRKHSLAIIHADDVMGPRQLRSSGSSCWFKVSDHSLSSIKVAVRTPQTRVSLSDPAVAGRPVIKNISWVGGFLNGVSIPVSEDLTSIIGGRGAGKSTVIESIRFALDIPALSSQVKEDHASVVNEVLKSGTVVKVEVESVYPTLQRYIIEREVSHNPIVKKEDGAATSLAPMDAIGPVEIFGQHELAELATDSASVAELVRRFNGIGGADGNLERIQKKLENNRNALAKMEEQKAELEEELAEIDRLEQKVRLYEDTDVPGRLVGQQALAQDSAVFDDVSQRISRVREKHRAFRNDSSISDLMAPISGSDDSKNKSYLIRSMEAANNLHNRLAEHFNAIDIALDDIAKEVEGCRSEWNTATEDERAEISKILRELSAEGLQPDKYLAVKDELARLISLRPRQESQESAIRQLLIERNELLTELCNHELWRKDQLRTSVAAANAATEGVVVVRPIPVADRTHVIDVVRSYIKGQRGQIVACIEVEEFTPKELAKAIRGGLAELADLNIQKMQADGLVKAGEPLCRELEELTIDLGVEVMLKVSDGKLRTISQLSKGQRATALLLLLLGASSAPLIIDQPEDDLDNNFVYEGIVKRLRALKGKRQIIASTHNANIPVLGDAELIVVLESDGSQGGPVEGGIGSLDNGYIRSLAEKILEGGPAAFNARHHLYGF